MQYFKYRTHLCNISNFEHTCAIFRTLNTLVQKRIMMPWQPSGGALVHCGGGQKQVGPQQGQASQKSWWQFPSLCLFVCSIVMANYHYCRSLNSGKNDSRRSQSRSILSNRWNLTSTTFVHPDDAASVYSDPKLMVNNYWIDSWLYFHFHSYSPGLTEGVNKNCCWWWWW